MCHAINLNPRTHSNRWELRSFRYDHGSIVGMKHLKVYPSNHLLGAPFRDGYTYKLSQNPETKEISASEKPSPQPLELVHTEIIVSRLLNGEVGLHHAYSQGYDVPIQAGIHLHYPLRDRFKENDPNDPGPFQYTHEYECAKPIAYCLEERSVEGFIPVLIPVTYERQDIVFMSSDAISVSKFTFMKPEDFANYVSDLCKFVHKNDLIHGRKEELLQTYPQLYKEIEKCVIPATIS